MKKRLSKSRNNRVITGTLAGISEYFGIDPTIVRIIYVFLSFTLIGSPVLLYILLAILIPQDRTTQRTYGHNNPYYRNNGYKQNNQERPRKEAEKVEEEDWSDF
jgi:Putative stress-responsive transcriptional regulator